MTLFLIIIQLLITLALVGVILLQRSEGGALGIGGGPGGLMTGRGAGDALTRATSILAVLFFVSSLGLTISVAADQRAAGVLDRATQVEEDAPAAPTDFFGTPLDDAVSEGADAEPEPADDAPAEDAPAPGEDDPAETPPADPGEGGVPL